jgi:hypothetical protein
MKLTSVRNFKHELTAELLAPARGAMLTERAVPRRIVASAGLAPGTRSAERFRTFAAPLGLRRPEESHLSVGVARGKGKNDYHVGVRIHAAGALGRALEETVRTRVGKEADIRFVPKVRKRAKKRPAWFRARRRPLEPGLSVGHPDITAGTLGAIVEDDEAYYVLSNNHVLADVNKGDPGDLMLQPGPLDRKASQQTVIGVLDRFVKISFARANLVDCAVSEISPEEEFWYRKNAALSVPMKGVKPLTVDDLAANLEVVKVGRTTGITRGRISLIEQDDLPVDMGDKKQEIAVFDDQIEIVGIGGNSFSDGGDSGSLILDRKGYARALLFSGGERDDGVDVTYANRIETVLGKLGVRLV